MPQKLESCVQLGGLIVNIFVFNSLRKKTVKTEQKYTKILSLF